MPAAPEREQEARRDFQRVSFRAMGTNCSMIFSAATVAQAESFAAEAIAWVEAFERRYSRFQAGSLISRINAAGPETWTPLEPRDVELFRLCDWYHWATDGVFDPSALPLLQLWDYRKTHVAVPDEKDVRKAAGLVGWKRVERDERGIRLPLAGMALDLGGIGKEYAVDCIHDLALARGIRDHLIDFGRDIRVAGSPPGGGPWKIGLEDPNRAKSCWGGLCLGDRAVCTSGDYARKVEIKGKVYGHIVDPRMGHPVANGVRSVTVLSPSCTEAGQLATALFILGPEHGLALLERFANAEACIITGTARFLSKGFMNYAEAHD